jgi:outer membrane protein TolC
MKKITMIILCVLAAADVAEAGSGFTLQDLLERMEDHNLVLRLIEIDRDILGEEYRMARSLPNPELGYSWGRADILDAPVTRPLWSWQVSWTLPNPIRRGFLLRSQKQSLARQEITGEMGRRTVLFEFMRHFYLLQYFEKKRSMLEEKRGVLEEMNRIIRARVEIGESIEMDQLRSSVELQRNRSELFNVMKRISHERTSINEFLNNTLPEDFSIQGDFSTRPLGAIEETVFAMIPHSPALREKKMEAEQRATEVNLHRWGFIDSFHLSAEKGRDVDADVWRLGVGVTVPLFKSESAWVKKAKLEARRARIGIDHFRKHFSAEIDRMAAEIGILEKEIETFRGAVLREGEENMELARKLYRAGEVPLMVFLDSQTSYYSLQERYYQSITEWKIRVADLYRILGVDS